MEYKDCVKKVCKIWKIRERSTKSGKNPANFSKKREKYGMINEKSERF